VAVLKGVYAKIFEKIRWQKATLRQRGKAKAALRFRAHQPDVFDTTDKLAKLKLKGLSLKKAHRWLMSGQLVMLNVAEGRFRVTDTTGEARRVDCVTESARLEYTVGQMKI